MTQKLAPSRARSGGRMVFVIGLYAVVLGLLAAPLVAVVVPPLVDYPNHLARVDVLARYGHSAQLQANYVVVWKLSPYLGMDLLAPTLAKIFGIYAAGRLFLFLCLLQIVAGVAAIHAALFGRLSAWPAAGAIFVYSLVMSFGFANYLFGIGVWLLAFAGWITLSRRSTAWRVVGGSLLSFAVFLSHYFAFAGYMICVGGYELGAWLTAGKRDLRQLIARGVIAFCPFIAPLVLFARASHGQPGGVTSYGAPLFKLYALLSPVIFQNGVNVALGALLAVLGLLLMFPGTRRRLFGRLTLAASMRAPLVILALIALATPSVLLGVAWMDIRLPVVLLWLFIASCEWRGITRRGGFIGAGVLVALLGAQMASIVWAWRPIARQFDDFRAAAAVIPKGARVIAFRDNENATAAEQISTLGYTHLPLLTVIERDAFVPILFKAPMMPVQAAAALRDIDTPTGIPIELSELIAGADPVKGPPMRGALNGYRTRNYWGGWPNTFDYAVELSFGAHPILPPQLQLVRSGAVFNIYRIAPGSPPPAGHPGDDGSPDRRATVWRPMTKHAPRTTRPA